MFCLSFVLKMKTMQRQECGMGIKDETRGGMVPAKFVGSTAAFYKNNHVSYNNSFDKEIIE